MGSSRKQLHVSIEAKDFMREACSELKLKTVFWRPCLSLDSCKNALDYPQVKRSLTIRKTQLFHDVSLQEYGMFEWRGPLQMHNYLVWLSHHPGLSARHLIDESVPHTINDRHQQPNARESFAVLINGILKWCSAPPFPKYHRQDDRRWR